MNVTLIGMAAAGKTYIGKPLAQRLGLEFVDIDDLLEKACGKTIQVILDENGAEKYLDLEAEMLISGTSGRDRILISPGGSIIYREPTMEHIKDISKVVYLKVPFETIEERMKNRPPRAVIGLGEKTLRQLFEERTPLYERYADIVVEMGQRDLEEVLGTIIDFVGVDRKSTSANL